MSPHLVLSASLDAIAALYPVCVVCELKEEVLKRLKYVQSVIFIFSLDQKCSCKETMEGPLLLCMRKAIRIKFANHLMVVTVLR